MLFKTLYMAKLKNKFTQAKYEAGCDEAGRGCLAGPVVAAAVILPDNINIEELNDSKQLSLNKRNIIKNQIIEQALAYAIGVVDNTEIDSLNILKSSILSMHKALDKLCITPHFIIVDGNKFSQYKNIENECIVKGDAKYMNIAAASILAKTHRDEIMLELDKKYPEYNWKQNKGYPTLEHKLAIYKYGLSSFHRKSFSWSIQMKLF